MTWARNPDASLLALALVGGIVDAFSYLGLGKVFTANMTGNTVLLAIAVATGHGTAAAHSAVALGGFCVGVAAGSAVVRRGPRWPRSVAALLGLEAVALAVVLLLWVIRGVPPVRYELIAVAGVGMGAQSAAVRFSDVTGVNTTFMTSTLMNAIARMTLRLRGIRDGDEGPMLPAAAWLMYGIAALVGALLVHAWGAVAVAPPLAIVSGVALAASRASA